METPLADQLLNEVPEDDFLVSLDEEPEEDFVVGVEETRPTAEGHYGNLAPSLDEKTLKDLSGEIKELFESDRQSREEWDKITAEAVELLGFKIDDRTEPFEGACGATHPLLAKAVVTAQAKALKEMVPFGGPVKTRIYSTESPDKIQRGNRVRRHMNWQFLKQMPEFRTEADKMLFHMFLFGTGYIKLYYDAILQRPAPCFVRSHDLIMDFYSKGLKGGVSRYTHIFTLTAHEVRQYVKAGIYREPDYSNPSEPKLTETETVVNEQFGQSPPSFDGQAYQLGETHLYLDLEGDDMPYCVTWDIETGFIFSIRRSWRENDPLRQPIKYFAEYGMIPGLGAYSYGYLHLVGGLVKSATSITRQLTDAGTFANMPAGFAAAGFRVKGEKTFAPGEWKDTNIAPQLLKDSLLPLPYKEPSQALMAMLQLVINEGKELANNVDAVVSNSTGNGPVGTILALLENSGELYSAVHQRLHYSQQDLIKILVDINREYMDESFTFLSEGADMTVYQQDYAAADLDVVPVSDPNMPTEAHRIAKIQVILDIASKTPQIHNMQAILTELYVSLGFDDPSRFFQAPPQSKTADPVTENSAAIMGQSIKAGMHQNHDAHIAVHKMILMNPAYKDSGAVLQALGAHVNEHLAMKAQTEMMQMMPPEMQQAMMSGQPLPPEVENQIALLAQQASDAILKYDELKLKVMAGEAEDPLVEVAREDVAVKAFKAKADAKAKEDANILKAHELGLKATEIAATIQQNAKELEVEKKIHTDVMKKDVAGMIVSSRKKETPK